MLSDAPQLVVIPATPTSFSRSSPSNAFALDSSIIEPQKDSSETAIVTIYSMYGADDSTTGSWSATARTTPEQGRIGLVIPNGDNNVASDPIRKLPFVPILPDTQPRPLPIIDQPNSCNGAPPPARPGSSHSSVQVPFSPTMAEHPLGRPRSRSRSRSPRKRQASPPNRKSAFINRDLPPVPDMSSPPSDTTPLSRTPTPRQQQEQQQDPPSVPPSLAVSRNVSPSSKSSLTPTVGEDPDAFLVRSTYAQLEVQGVTGDGYEEGVERTRAKVGTSRSSQLNAERALGNKKGNTGELSPKEIETLASLDRYGFFNIPSHDRLVLLPSTQLLRRLAPTLVGPRTAPVDATPLNSVPPPALTGKETSRIGKWNRMLLPSGRDIGGNIESWAIKSSKEVKLRERVYKGIPDRWRNAAWDLLMGRFSRLGKLEVAKLVGEYAEALEKPSSYDIQIDLDVPRTISGHVMFHTRYGAGQRALFHVLHSFSLRCPDCGYVQGMGPIAATLLCYFEPERVYVSMVRLHDAYDLHRLFSPGFPGLLEAIYVQERITECMMPEVYNAFRKHMISTTSYATKWYITLFANSVPFETQLRLWDAFLLEGPDVFVAVAVAIVWVYRDQITSASANFETVLSLLSSFFVPEDENLLLSWIGKTLGNQKLRSSMRQWRVDWQRLVQKGEDGDVLL